MKKRIFTQLLSTLLGIVIVTLIYITKVNFVLALICGVIIGIMILVTGYLYKLNSKFAHILLVLLFVGAFSIVHVIVYKEIDFYKVLTFLLLGIIAYKSSKYLQNKAIKQKHIKK